MGVVRSRDRLFIGMSAGSSDEFRKTRAFSSLQCFLFALRIAGLPMMGKYFLFEFEYNVHSSACIKKC